MELFPPAPLDIPAVYRIQVLGGFERGWAERFWGMTACPVSQMTGEEEMTMLVGEVRDQAALMGILNSLYNMGHTVVSVERIDPEADLSSDDTNVAP